MAPSSDPSDNHNKQKEGFHNMGFSRSSNSTLKLEADNNQVNHRLHAAPPTEVYIIQPEGLGTRWMAQEKFPSQVPVYPNTLEYQNQNQNQNRSPRSGWDNSITECAGTESLSADEMDEGVGGTPEYPCDTGDEGSVLSVDIHTSTTSLSSGDTRDELRLPKTPDVSTVESGISVMKSEDEDEDEEEEVHSITDSMVAEALAALEAATAGEESE